jgi:hypothetical protein
MGSALAFGALIGVTISYLGVHWPSDTTFGLVLGAGLGTLWGHHDPYAWLVYQGLPLLSLGVASGMTASLTLLLVLARRLTPDIDSERLTEWGQNLSSYALEGDTTKAAVLPKGRNIRSKIAMLSTVYSLWHAQPFTACTCPPRWWSLEQS